MASGAKKLGWFLLDIVPDVITAVRHGRSAMRQKKLARQERREGIVATWRAKQKIDRRKSGQ